MQRYTVKNSNDEKCIQQEAGALEEFSKQKAG